MACSIPGCTNPTPLKGQTVCVDHLNVNTNMREECAALAARFTLYLLTRGDIKCASADACNLWTLTQVGLGIEDPTMHNMLEEIMDYVSKQMS